MMSDSSDDSDLFMLMQLSDWDSSSSSSCYDWDSYSEPSSDQNTDVEIEPQKKNKSRINHMHVLNDYEFTYKFRLSKTAVSNLLTEIYPLLKVTSRRNNGISPLHQLLLTLRYYALGTMLVSVADFVGVSKTSAGRILNDVSSAIAKLYTKYIFVHDNTEQDFYNISRLPRVLGVIDGTHIQIQSNSKIGEELRNRKGYHSMNVQVVCDANLKFMNMDAQWPGSTHDATVFNNSALKDECQKGLHGNRWLIGDGAYPCSPYLLTPLIQPTSHSQQAYNAAHEATRNTIERCIEVWKRRFPVMSVKIRLLSPTVQSITIATAVLHNICIEMDIKDVSPEVEIPSYEDVPMMLCDPSDVYVEERQELILNHFSCCDCCQ